VDGADQHVDLVALDQLVDVVGGLGRVGLVVDLHVLDLAPAELAALLVDVEPEAVLDGDAQRGVGAGVGQHEADLQFLALGLGRRRGQQRSRGKRCRAMNDLHGFVSS